MPAPSISDYSKTILRAGSDAFKQLKGTVFIPSNTVPFKNFSFGSGSYAAVFKGQTPDGKLCAVKCFTTIQEDIHFRQKAISNYLSSFEADWKVACRFLDNEITVNGSDFPVVVLDWIDGKPLNTFITENLTNNQVLTNLQKQLVVISKDLEKHKVGHGDLQCGNILVQGTATSFRLKLIDYDGMFIPQFSGLDNQENGRYEFQHPLRTKDYFALTIDRFSVWVMLTTLEALKYDKSLWEKQPQGGFNTEENMLFLRADFQNFDGSALVQRLRRINEKSLHFYLDKLRIFCNGTLTDISKPKLYKYEKVVAPTQPISPPVDSYIIIKANGDTEVYDIFGNYKGKTPLKIKRPSNWNAYKAICNGEEKKFTITPYSQMEIYLNFEENRPPVPTISPLPPKPNTSSTNSFIVKVLFGIALAAFFLRAYLWIVDRNERVDSESIEANKENPQSLISEVERGITNPYGKGNGQVSFWTNTRKENIKLYIDNKYVGILPHSYEGFSNSFSPDCSSPSILPVRIKAGKYFFKAIGKTATWEGDIEVRENDCYPQLLYKDESSIMESTDFHLEHSQPSPSNLSYLDRIIQTAEAGDVVSQFKVGKEYFAMNNYKEAFNWFQIAASNDHIESQYYTGLFYSEGKGVTKSAFSAALWYKKAAENGHVLSQYIIGLKYENGEGVLKDEDEAHKWFRKAANQGNQLAQYKVDEYLMKKIKANQ